MCHGESGETDMPPVPGPNVPSAESVSEGKAPRLRLLGPTDGKLSSVGVIARKYSLLVKNLACSKPLAYLGGTRNQTKVIAENPYPARMMERRCTAARIQLWTRFGQSRLIVSDRAHFHALELAHHPARAPRL